MNPETFSRQRAAGKGGNRIEDLVELIDSLVDVINEENVVLAMGLPASQSRLTQQKMVLAEQFEKWVAEVSMRQVLLCTPDRALQEKVLQRIECLRRSMDENMIRLRAAIEASQRRIDAIMGAIREQIADNSPYRANGRVYGHSASSGTSLRV
jgi:hypothetical protein